MKDKYKELQENLIKIIEIIDNFKLSKNDYIKPDIRSYQLQISHLGKIIGNKVKKAVDDLIIIIDEYLSCPNQEKYEKLIFLAKKLQENIWEL